MPGKSKSAKYYAKNPKARAVKNAYQKEFNKKKSSIKKIVELTTENRKRGNYGNGDGIDLHHKKGGGFREEPASVNRARKEKSRLKGSKRKKKK